MEVIKSYLVILHGLASFSICEILLPLYKKSKENVGWNLVLPGWENISIKMPNCDKIYHDYRQGFFNTDKLKYQN